MNAEKEKQNYHLQINDLWRLIKLTIDKYGNKEMSDEDWGDLITAAMVLTLKYDENKFICEITLSWLEEFERRKMHESRE